jgi:Co/Zn/Cd efflux system component
MPQRRKRSRHLNPAAYILLLLLNEGTQSVEQLQEHVLRRTLTLSRWGRRTIKPEDRIDVPGMCSTLVYRKLVITDDQGRFTLTANGQAEAENIARRMQQGANTIENQFLKPSAAARNITISYIILAVLKLTAGLMSGSVGLIADGADTTVDTISSSVVWAGIKLKKELIGTLTIIALMFVTAGLLFFESITSIIENIQGTFTPMTMSLVVIFVEGLVVAAMFSISNYQRLVGRRSQSLPLISQSIDSQNSIYSSIAVVIGAIFTLAGINWVDAVVGGFIAARITVSGINLTREVAKSMNGQKPEFSKYKLPFEEQREQHRMEGFRNWILYEVYRNKACTKEEIIGTLEKTFRPSYLPELFTELRIGRNVDFHEIFPEIIAPLIGECYLNVHSDDTYTLTSKGKTFIKDTIDTIKYKQTEL